MVARLRLPARNKQPIHPGRPAQDAHVVDRLLRGATLLDSSRGRKLITRRNSFAFHSGGRRFIPRRAYGRPMHQAGPRGGSSHPGGRLSLHLSSVNGAAPRANFTKGPNKKTYHKSTVPYRGSSHSYPLSLRLKSFRCTLTMALPQGANPVLRIAVKAAHSRSRTTRPGSTGSGNFLFDVRGHSRGLNRLCSRLLRWRSQF